MVPLRIRVYGDPVLRRVAAEVTDIDGVMADLCQQMFTAMYEASGIGLAAPQVGVSQRFFVYDFGEGPGILMNPEIIGSDGEWAYNEGCLSVPELSWEIIRPRRIHMRAYDLDGNEVSIEAEDLQARLFQHELDHLEGKMLLDYLDEDQRREAKRILRQRAMGDPGRPPGFGTSRSGVGRVEVPVVGDPGRLAGSGGELPLP